MVFNWGSAADWIVAIFTGATAYFVWRQMQPHPPTVEVEHSGDIAAPDQLLLRVTIRNHDQRHSYRIDEVACPAGADYSGTALDRRNGDDPIPPGAHAVWLVSLRGPGARDGTKVRPFWIVLENASTRKRMRLRAQI